MTLRSRLFAPVASLAALLGAGCATAPAEAEPRPALWQVSDDDTRIYLFGTVHLLPEGTEWRTQRFGRAFAAADTLVLEVDLPADPAAQASRYTALAASPGLPPLLDRVPPAERAALERVVANAGFRPGQLDTLETWAAALAIGSRLYAESSLSAGAGVEATLKGAAAGKRVVALETLEEQLGFFDTLPEASQRGLLSGLIAEAEGASGAFAGLVAAWTAGDVDRIATEYADAEGLSPEVADALLRRRNQAWSRWVRDRLATPGTVMVAVGAGHLAGEGSVIDLLQQDRMRVSRVQ